MPLAPCPGPAAGPERRPGLGAAPPAWVRGCCGCALTAALAPSSLKSGFGVPAMLRRQEGIGMREDGSSHSDGIAQGLFLLHKPRSLSHAGQTGRPRLRFVTYCSAAFNPIPCRLNLELSYWPWHGFVHVYLELFCKVLCLHHFRNAV